MLGKKILFAAIAMIPLCLSAQQDRPTVLRGNCTPSLSNANGLSRTRGILREDPDIIPEWDSTRTYRQLVILINYSDSTFICENPRQWYDRVFNEHGYNEGIGPGCVADYFHDQSNGLFNVRFDVYGPYGVANKACPNPNSSSNFGTKSCRDAYQAFCADNPDMDTSPYDWDGNGVIDQVIFICSSYSGSETGKDGYTWPNSDVLYINDSKIKYSIIPELWSQRISLGIGTICHEYCHCLGLPDIYPTSGPNPSFSVCDEWDLMDGGNYTNWGWCPPNLSAQEKMFLGWFTPTDLDGPVSITGMKPVSEGGTVYKVTHTETEYLILENRQCSGWDAGLPGNGLIIFHIDYATAPWKYNTVNVYDNHLRYDICHADNMNYDDWDKIVSSNDDNQYAIVDSQLHNRHLSTSSYPWVTYTGAYANDCLTDSSTPSIVMFNNNAQGSAKLDKPITNIRLASDGTISFDFMGGGPNSINPAWADYGESSWYTIDGRRLNGVPVTPGFYINNKRKVVIR